MNSSSTAGERKGQVKMGRLRPRQPLRSIKKGLMSIQAPYAVLIISVDILANNSLQGVRSRATLGNDKL